MILGSVGIDDPTIYQVEPGSPAAEAGIQDGDTILKLGNKNIHFYREISVYTYFHNGERTDVLWEHDGEKFAGSVTPRYDEESGRYLFGFQGSYGRQKASPLRVMQYSFYEMKYWISTTLQSLGKLVTGQLNMNDLSGPVGIVKTIGDTYTASRPDGIFYVFIKIFITYTGRRPDGFFYVYNNMINLPILLSANLGGRNLLLLPPLDGGRLVFFIIEAIRGKRIDPQKEGMVHYVGLIVLMVLMVVIMGNDVRKLFM